MGEVVEIQKKKQGEMDEYFIEHYLETNNIADSYRYAKNQLGHEFKDEYAKQYGMALFKKLRAEISEKLDEMEVEDAALSRNVLRNLAANEEVSASTRVAAAKELARKRIERPSVKKSKDVAELDAEIKSINEQLKEYSDGKD